MNNLDLFLEMLEGMKELVERSRTWYSGSEVDNEIFTEILNQYMASYLSGVADLIRKGEGNENTSN